jgi:hypothetical protein
MYLKYIIYKQNIFHTHTHTHTHTYIHTPNVEMQNVIKIGLHIDYIIYERTIATGGL